MAKQFEIQKYFYESFQKSELLDAKRRAHSKKLDIYKKKQGLLSNLINLRDKIFRIIIISYFIMISTKNKQRNNQNEANDQFQVDEIMNRTKIKKRKGRKIISNAMIFRKKEDGSFQVCIEQQTLFIKVQKEQKIRQKAIQLQKECDKKIFKNLQVDSNQQPPPSPLPQDLKKAPSPPKSINYEHPNPQNFNMLPICFYPNFNFSFLSPNGCQHFPGQTNY